MRPAQVLYAIRYAATLVSVVAITACGAALDPDSDNALTSPVVHPTACSPGRTSILVCLDSGPRCWRLGYSCAILDGRESSMQPASDAGTTSDPCAVYTDCSTCAMASQCGWCGGRCMTGTSATTVPPACGGQTWTWHAADCSSTTTRSDAGAGDSATRASSCVGAL